MPFRPLVPLRIVIVQRLRNTHRLFILGTGFCFRGVRGLNIFGGVRDSQPVHQGLEVM